MGHKDNKNIENKSEKEEEIMKHLPKSFQLLAKLIEEVDREIKPKKGLTTKNKGGAQ